MRLQWYKFIICAGVSAAGFYAAFIMTEGKKARSEFCISCHLTPSERLHQEKYNDFKGPVPKNLAAVHKKEIACIGCHKGINFLEEFFNIKKEVINTVKYFFGTFEEPAKLSPPFVDGNCESCHRQLKADKLFHKAAAHQGKFTVRCTECHTAHKKGGRSEQYFILQNILGEQCRRCHKNYIRAEEYVDSF